MSTTRTKATASHHKATQEAGFTLGFFFVVNKEHARKEVDVRHVAPNQKRDVTMPNETRKILFICTGNICRSPTAEGVFRALLEQEGFAEQVEVDSAGTTSYHVGSPPDSRTQAAARRRGYDLSVQRARQIQVDDCRYYDYLIVMDSDNDERVRGLCTTETHKVRRFLEFAPDTDVRDVPDPYYGGEQGFERVLDLIEAASRGLLDELRTT